MTLQRAIAILKSEMEFLGVGLGMLESLMETQPGAFSVESLEAWDRYKEAKSQ